MIAFRKSAVVALAAAVVAIGVILLAAWRLWDVRVASQSSPAETQVGSAPAGQPTAPPTPSPAQSASRQADQPGAAPSASVSPTLVSPTPTPAPSAPEQRLAVTTPRRSTPPTVSSSPSARSPIGREQVEVKPTTPAQEAAPAGAAKPSFDIVRIEPSGEAVVAGRAPPRSRVALLVAGKRYGEAVADTNGQFVILPQSLPPGDHVLSLSADTGATGAIASDQTVAVAVPARNGGEVVAALVAPGKPTVVLSETPKPRAAAPVAEGKASAKAAATGEMLIRSVEAQQGGALFVSGMASPGAQLRLYLNDSFVASVAAGADGKWSVRVQRGMSSGAYRVRADQVGADGKAIARVEAPFDYPVAIADASKPAPPIVARLGDEQPVAPVEGQPGVRPAQSAAANPAPAQSMSGAAGDAAAGSASSPTHAVVEELRTAKVERGDSLWRISRTIYGEGMRYTQIYDANTSQIRDPDLIYPGQVFVVPKQQEGAP